MFTLVSFSKFYFRASELLRFNGKVSVLQEDNGWSNRQ